MKSKPDCFYIDKKYYVTEDMPLIQFYYSTV